LKLSSNEKNATVFGLTALILGLPTITFVLQDTTPETHLLIVLRSLGRLSFIIFLLVFIIRPLRDLIVSPLTNWLLRNRRYIGICLASAMTVHLVFIIWRWVFVRGEHITFMAYLTGAVFYGLLYMMLITSFSKPAAAVGPRNWRRLHKTGTWGLALLFAYTFRLDIVKVFDEPIYALFGALSLIAVTVRVLAFVKRRNSKIAEPV